MKSLVEEVREVLDFVDSLKGSAQANRDFGDYDDAIEDLDKAIARLDPIIRKIEGIDQEQVKDYKSLRLKLARELADCYGMKGGIYRRKKDLRKAEAMYEAGSIYEQDYDIPDTYNRTNIIVLRLLRDPTEHETLREIIKKSLEVVQDQVKGKNKNKWWSWADFGLLNLLSVSEKETGYRTLYQNTAHNAYVQFVKNGAGIQHFDSTIEVLEQLKQSFKKVDEAIALSIKEEIDYLIAQIPER